MSSIKGGKEYTVGYWYGLGMHMVLCHGPVDALLEVQVGERTAWTGKVTANSSLSIQQRDLFGGEEREGGVDGTLDVLFGAANQMPNPYLQDRLGADIPAFRGVFSVVWRGLVAAMNPYIKPWRFRVQRIPRAWYPAKAEINGDANPAHILYECLIDPHWGMGYPPTDIDEASFQAAADTLYGEGFGLSILWSQEQPIEDFLLTILRHIDGVLYVHPKSGRFTLKLARADDHTATIPVLSPANVLAVEEFTRPSWGEITNQVTILYRDGATDQDASITVQDIAAVQLQGGVVATTLQYPGISRADLANRVAMRELKQLSSTLAKVTLVANRQASSLDIGDVFRFTWPAYGIAEMIFRVARISYGELADGRVRIEAVQDIFGLPDAVYSTPPPTGWQDPIHWPAPCPAQMAYELPYWQIVKDVTGESTSILNDIDPSEGLIATLGARPSADAIDYHAFAWDLAKSTWADRGRGTFAPTGLLAAALPQSATQVTVTLASAVDLDLVKADDFAIIDDEWLLVLFVQVSSQQVTLARGVLDTVPAAHTAGSRVWFATYHRIQPEYVAGETAQLRLCPKTGKGELAVSLASTITHSIQQRFIRPYPPGNVQINGQRYPKVISSNEDMVITWANRNRVHQTASVIRQTDGNITPEPGQSTTIRFYDAENTLLRSYAGLTGTSLTCPLAEIFGEGNVVPARVRISIEAKRTDDQGTFSSLQKHDIICDLAD
ncbi:MAG: phage tail protein [Acidithiobacillus sp.]|uniref:phage tail protein n=1 Tax=Acidithiobacillus sp. TaxID=1872118 RepID=UPI002582E96E|nr:phage tail protein [Acidithiobacillus sp.]MCE5420246.1 phage tail protein [Acidithiobacillus sp.]